MDPSVRTALERLTESARRVAAGDLSGSALVIEGTPEVVALAGAFAAMVTSLRDHEAALAREVREKDEALERSKAADRAKSSFLANMSHELRTPLNAIIGYSEMLREDALDSGNITVIDDLDRIKGAGQHLLSLINNVLDLAKIEAGRTELHLETVNVPQLVEEVAGTTRALAERNGDQLVVSCPANTGAMTTDVTKLRQVLYNLLSNACKFTENGAVTLRIGTEDIDGRECVVFEVADSGIGMTEAQLGRLFQEFSQADASTTRKYGGTGLGLAISKKFAEMMGGEVTVRSAIGYGTTFRLVLPRVATPTRPATIEARDRAGEGTETIIVADDDPMVRDILVRSLARSGFRAVGAATGDECVRLARELKPAAITLDVLMPGMDGWSVLAALKADVATADIPVVMITIAEEAERGYALGADDYLTKPVDRDRLRRVLGRYLRTGPVLVVEDDPVVRDVLVRTLAKDGWAVEQAADGRIALERLPIVRPSLVLLDLMLPHVDGFEVLAALRASEHGRNVPVVVITAMDLNDEQRVLLGTRAAHVLEKRSLSRDELVAQVRSQVTRARQRQSPTSG